MGSIVGISPAQRTVVFLEKHLTQTTIGSVLACLLFSPTSDFPQTPADLANTLYKFGREFKVAGQDDRAGDVFKVIAEIFSAHTVDSLHMVFFNKDHTPETVDRVLDSLADAGVTPIPQTPAGLANALFEFGCKLRVAGQDDRAGEVFKVIAEVFSAHTVDSLPSGIVGLKVATHIIKSHQLSNSYPAANDWLIFLIENLDLMVSEPPVTALWAQTYALSSKQMMQEQNHNSAIEYLKKSQACGGADIYTNSCFTDVWFDLAAHPYLQNYSNRLVRLFNIGQQFHQVRLPCSIVIMLLWLSFRLQKETHVADDVRDALSAESNVIKPPTLRQIESLWEKAQGGDVSFRERVRLEKLREKLSEQKSLSHYFR